MNAESKAMDGSKQVEASCHVCHKNYVQLINTVIVPI